MKIALSTDSETGYFCRGFVFMEISMEIHGLMSAPASSFLPTNKFVNFPLANSPALPLPPAQPRENVCYEQLRIIAGYLHISITSRGGEPRFIVAACFSSPEVRHRRGRTSELYQPLHVTRELASSRARGRELYARRGTIKRELGA